MIFFHLCIAFAAFVYATTKFEELKSQMEKQAKESASKTRTLKQQLEAANNEKLNILKLSQRMMARQNELQNQKEEAEDDAAGLRENLEEVEEQLEEEKLQVQEAKQQIQQQKQQLAEAKEDKFQILKVSQRIIGRQEELQRKKDEAIDIAAKLQEKLDDLSEQLEAAKAKILQQQPDIEATTSSDSSDSSDSSSDEDEGKQHNNIDWESAEQCCFSDDDTDGEWEDRHGDHSSALDEDLAACNVAPFRGFDYVESEEELKQLDSFFFRK
jgi:chromosome segregation ATPase